MCTAVCFSLKKRKLFERSCEQYTVSVCNSLSVFLIVFVFMNLWCNYKDTIYSTTIIMD